MSYVDSEFRGQRQAIAAVIMTGAGYCAVIDPGPAVSLERLEAGLEARGVGLEDLTHILLTHIHLDHAGATGALVRRSPDARVLVQERGARHLQDPSRLLESAARLYGPDLEQLWGAFLAVPAHNLAPLRGGERIALGGRTIEVAYTPGHASHHVSYFDAESGIAFIGDTGGVTTEGGYVLPPTPPPDIDLEAWRASVEAIEAWNPDALFITHFGVRSNPRVQFRSLVENLDRLGAQARRLLEEAGEDASRQEQFTAWLRRELRREMPEHQVAAYEVAAPLDQHWLGLARDRRKRGVT